jgi:hypothetical protein
LGTHTLFSPAYHPSSNGQVERMMRTIRTMIASFCKEGEYWDKWLRHLRSVYNSAPHKTTNETPHFLMFGRDPFYPQTATNDQEESFSNTKRWLVDTVQEILKAGIGLGLADQMADMGIDSSRGKPVDKLRQGVVWIRSSPQNIERFKGFCKTSDLTELQLSLDVRTRWNSTYEMIQRAHLLSPAFDMMMGSGPEHMRLSASDWQFLKVALLILQPFEDFTKLNSASRYATINMATISYVNLRSSLATTYTILC